MKLKDSIALVTGAGRGIGRAIALMLASEGARVLLTARSEPELEATERDIRAHGGEAECLQGDLTDDAWIDEMFGIVERRYGKLGILVNNAGIGRFAPVRALSFADLDDMWRLNFRAQFACCQRAIPLLEKNKGGVIVNVSSLAGKNAFVGGAGYAATKWALLGFSRCLMLEERDKNIRVVTVSPGSVDTAFSSNRNPAKASRILTPDDVADAIRMAVIMPERAMVSEIDIRPTRP